MLPELTSSKSYFVTVKQVPVALDPLESGGARLQVIFAFDAAVHVVPRGAKADPQAVSVSLDEMSIRVETGEFETKSDGSRVAVTEEKTVPAATITMRNDGTKYFYVQDQVYDVSGTDASGQAIDFPEWTTQEILSVVPVVLVQPGASRTIKLPLPEGTDAKNLSVTIKQREGL